MAKKFLTLNIGAANIELAEYEASGKGSLKLVNYGTAPLEAPLDAGNADTVLSPALLGIVRERGIRPGSVSISVAGQMVFPKFAAIPMAGGEEKFEQMVRYEIEQGIPFPIDEMVCDRQVLGDLETGDKSVMIVAAKIDQIEAITSAVAASGFTPEIVDVAPIALTNALRFNHPESEGECSVILDIGAKTTSLVIVEGDKIYNRSIPVAGNTITKDIAQALGCTSEEAEQVKREKGYVSLGGVTEDEDEVADRVSKVCRAVLTRLHAEISRSINFYRSQQNGSMPSKLYLTGGSALLPQMDQFLVDSLQIEVEYLNPFERIAVGPKVDASALEADVAVIAATAGVALHAAESARFAINLLPPALVQERAEKAKIPYVIVGGLALVGSLVMLMLTFSHKQEVVGAQRQGADSRVGELERFDRQVTTAKGKLDEAKADAEAFRELLASRSKASQNFNAVKSSLLGGMWIEKWEDGKVTVRYWKDRIKNTGGKPAGELVMEKLKGRPNVIPESVKIPEMVEIGKEGQVQQFSMTVKFK